jgi:Family of unknown function (DUF6481)
MAGFKDLGFAERRNAAADAKRAALEKFREHAAASVAAERQKARTTGPADSGLARGPKDKKRARSRKIDTSK